MTCPTCNDSGIIGSITSGSVGMTRVACPDPCHTETASPARPDDFATESAVPHTPPRTSQGEAASGLPDASKDSLFEAARAMPSSVLVSVTPISPPYTTLPPGPVAGNTGFRWCHECQSVADVAGHECGPFSRGALDAAWGSAMKHLRDAGEDPEAIVDAAAANLARWESEARAELAESLLCALAWDHRTALEFGAFEFCDDSDFIEHACDEYECVFCDAERKREVRR